MRTLKWAAIWLVILAVAAVALWQVAIRWHPDEGQYPVQGVTIGAAQGEVHWPTLSANGADFAYIMATDGDAGRDENFEANWAAARESGMRYGAVHNWQLCRLAADQATNFIAPVPSDANALPPAVMLRFEGNCSDRPDIDVLMDELSTFLRMIERQAESPAILYVTRDFDDMYAITRNVERSFWLSRRLFKPDYGAVPWSIWEASDIRQVPGVENPVRWNVVRPGSPG